MNEKSIVGDLINFRGLVYSPVNEDGVIFLFGKVAEDLNMYIEEIKPGFPDCVGRRFTGRGWEKVYIEFEYVSSNFKTHGHDASNCDIIVCWQNDWPACPIKVIALRDVIKPLPNDPIERPDAATKPGVVPANETLRGYPPNIAHLFESLDAGIKGISGDIWRKDTKTSITYYSPERVFLYVFFQKQGLRLVLFTRGQTIPGVTAFEYERGGAKWGRMYVRAESEIGPALQSVKQSLDVIRHAIDHNEPTGWWPTLGDAVEGRDTIDGDQDGALPNADDVKVE